MFFYFCRFGSSLYPDNKGAFRKKGFELVLDLPGCMQRLNSAFSKALPGQIILRYLEIH